MLKYLYVKEVFSEIPSEISLAVSITGCLISALTDKKIKVIFCDEKRDPTCELVSL